MLTTYLGDQLTGILMIYNEGNEWKNPQSAILESQLKSNMEKMLRDRAAKFGMEDVQTEGFVYLFNMMYSSYMEPGVKSMLTDINQYNASDKRLESRTDDLNAVLRLTK